MKKLIYTIVVLFTLNSSFLILNCFAQWQPDVRLTNDPAGSYTSQNNAWCVASSGLVVHVVWYDKRDGNWEIYYKRSTDAGVSWGTDIRLTNDAAYSRYPSVAVSGSAVHVVWEDNRANWEIYYKRSSDGGVSWGADTRLTNNSAESYASSVAVSGSVVHVVWHDYRDGNWEIYFKRSTDAGINWGADTRMTNNTNISWYSSLAVSGSFVHVVWRDYRDGNDEIYYKRSTDAGVSWGADTRLTNNTSVSWNPSIAVSDSVVHIVWWDERDYNEEIYYKRSTNAGLSWGADTRLTNYSSESWYPSIAVSGSVVHIVWEDNRDAYDEIYYKRSTDGGVSWGADTRLTDNISWSMIPSVAVSGSVVHVVWEDTRDGGNPEIYYKRNPTGNPTRIENITSEIPSSYSLEQNYPNPFNSMTKIKFDIPPLNPPLVKGGRGLPSGGVSLKVYNLLGKEIATLVNESALGGQPGTYEVTFDASMLPSGIYFYRLTAEDFSETKRMILIK
jgi:hypothetical protein